MDLALHLGMTEQQLMRSMSERELQGWAAYARQRMLPMRRIEMHLAQISRQLASGLGGVQHTRIEDYLFDLKDSESDLDEGDAQTDMPTPEEIAAESGATLVR